MQRPARHAGPKAFGLFIALALGAGALTAAVGVPVVGVAGVVIRDASKTWINLPLKGLGQVPQKSELLDAQGKVLATYYPRGIYRDPVHWHQIAPVMRSAIVAIEDYRFWHHGAFDVHGTLRALFSTLSGHGVQGGSDLAQQYVKNACVLTARTVTAQLKCTAFSPSRKLVELRIAANVERSMTRPQLLTAYLNVAYFANQAYGIKVASETYFSIQPNKLDLTQAALLAGIVNSPTQYDPVNNPKNATFRRNEVLHAMAEHGYISKATAKTAMQAPLGLKLTPVSQRTGCTGPSVKYAAFFCDFVMSSMKHNPAYAKAYHELQTVGGLKIYTTLNQHDQHAADNAVDYVLPNRPFYNPNHDVDAEVLIQPGTGYVRAIAIDRPYGNGKGQDSVDYAVNTVYDGGAGVQTGSSSKLFTLVTALKQGTPFGFNLKYASPASVQPYYNCKGQYVPPFQVVNAEGAGKGIATLYNGTTESINVFYAELESHVGLCAVVKTAASMGMTRADGTSLLKKDPNLPKGNNYSADNYPSFTLGSIYVSPMSMAAAYATVAARGVYCKPIAITQITDSDGKNLPIQTAGCHRVLSKGVADAASFILQGVLGGGGTAGNRGIGIPAAAKTGTANGGYYAAFAGYTPKLVGYVSVFNPLHPTGSGAMVGCPNSDYREIGSDYPSCPGQMFGDNAPGATWQYTFLHLHLKPESFVYPPQYPFFDLGNGFSSPKPPPTHKHGGGPGGGNGGGGNGGGGGGGNGGGGTGH